MSRPTRLVATVLGSLLATIGTQQADAYARRNGASGVCFGDPVWGRLPSDPRLTRVVPVQRHCRMDTPATSSPTIAELNDAQAWAFWMWTREWQSRISLFIDTSTCFDDGRPPGDLNWINNGADGSSVSWYGTGEVFGPSWLGVAPERQACWAFGGREIVEADTIVRIDRPGTTALLVPDASTDRGDCFRIRRRLVEFLQSHEIGHAYGLGHNDAWPTVMNSASSGVHHCNVGAGYRNQPFSDESAFMRDVYGRSNGVANFSGHAFHRNEMGEVVGAREDTLVRAAGATSVLVDSSYTWFTYENHRDCPVANNALSFTWVLIDDSVVYPTVANIAWTDGLVWWEWQCWPGMAYPTERGSTMVVSGGGLVPGRTYRLFARVDLADRVETDEGDNLVPLGLTVAW